MNGVSLSKFLLSFRGVLFFKCKLSTSHFVLVKTLMEFRGGWSLFDSCLPFVASLRLVVCFGRSAVPPHLCPLSAGSAPRCSST